MRRPINSYQNLFAKACWEVYEKPLGSFIQQSVEAGWDATEIYLKDRPESREEILRLHRDPELKLIAQISGSSAESVFIPWPEGK